jgi:hypothetical protein
MKKSFLIPLGVACAALLPQPLLAQTPVANAAASKTAVVRVYESPTNKILTSYGEGKTETVETAGPYGKKDQLRATEQLQKTIDLLYSQGYHMVTAVSGGVRDQPMVTYIFRRE